MNENRRAWLRNLLAGGLALGTAVGLAGCSDSQSTPDGKATPSPELEVDESKSPGFDASKSKKAR